MLGWARGPHKRPRRRRRRIRREQHQGESLVWVPVGAGQGRNGACPEAFRRLRRGCQLGPGPGRPVSDSGPERQDAECEPSRASTPVVVGPGGGHGGSQQPSPLAPDLPFPPGLWDGGSLARAPHSLSRDPCPSYGDPQFQAACCAVAILTAHPRDLATPRGSWPKVHGEAAPATSWTEGNGGRGASWPRLARSIPVFKSSESCSFLWLSHAVLGSATQWTRSPAGGSAAALPAAGSRAASAGVG